MSSKKWRNGMPWLNPLITDSDCKRMEAKVASAYVQVRGGDVVSY